MLRWVVVVEGLQSRVGFGLAGWLLLLHVNRGGDAGAALLLAYWALNLPVLGAEIALLTRQYPIHRNVTLRLLEPLGAPEARDDRVDTAAPAAAPPRRSPWELAASFSPPAPSATWSRVWSGSPRLQSPGSASILSGRQQHAVNPLAIRDTLSPWRRLLLSPATKVLFSMSPTWASVTVTVVSRFFRMSRCALARGPSSPGRPVQRWQIDAGRGAGRMSGARIRAAASRWA